MPELTKESIETAIKEYIDPHLGRDLVSAKLIKGVDIEGDQVKVRVTLGFPANGVVDRIAAAVKEKVEALPGARVDNPNRWFLVARPERWNSAKLSAFRRWLRDEISADDQLPSPPSARAASG